MVEPSFIIPAFFSGLLTFLAPCTLPLVPAFLAFISGAALGDLDHVDKVRAIRTKIIINALFYVFGFSVIFISMGVLAGILGSAVLVGYRLWISRIGGAFAIVFGMAMLGAFRIPIVFSAPGRVRFNGNFFNRAGLLNSFILGSAFALGWTPCIGPVLATILLVASTSATILEGALLLSVFSFGLAIPFLLVAVGINSSAKIIRSLSSHLGAVSKIGGVFIIFIGALLLTNNMSILISWGYRLLRFINYGGIINYL